MLSSCTVTTQLAMQLAPDGRELIHHGTPLFPCAFYLDDYLPGAGQTLPWHWHPEVELIYVRSGSLMMGVGSARFPLHAGEGVFINSNALHGLWAESRCALPNLVFDPLFLAGSTETAVWQRYIQPVLACPALAAVPLSPGVPWQKTALDALQRAYAAGEGSAYGLELAVQSALSEFWLALAANNRPHPADAAGPDPAAERTKAMLNCIRRRYAEPLTLAEIAAAASISEREALRCFTATLQTTPVEYLVRTRVAAAARLLRETDQPITAICLAAGFNTPNYFSKVFSRRMGCTPRAYRAAGR